MRSSKAFKADCALSADVFASLTKSRNAATKSAKGRLSLKNAFVWEVYDEGRRCGFACRNDEQVSQDGDSYSSGTAQVTFKLALSLPESSLNGSSSLAIPAGSFRLYAAWTLPRNLSASDILRRPVDWLRGSTMEQQASPGHAVVLYEYTEWSEEKSRPYGG